MVCYANLSSVLLVYALLSTKKSGIIAKQSEVKRIEYHRPMLKQGENTNKYRFMPYNENR